MGKTRALGYCAEAGAAWGRAASPLLAWPPETEAEPPAGAASSAGRDDGTVPISRESASAGTVAVVAVAPRATPSFALAAALAAAPGAAAAMLALKEELRACATLAAHSAAAEAAAFLALEVAAAAAAAAYGEKGETTASDATAGALAVWTTGCVRSGRRRGPSPRVRRCRAAGGVLARRAAGLRRRRRGISGGH